MAKRSLSSREWKAFAGHRTVGPDLLAALLRLEKTSDADDALTVLEEIDEKAKALAKTHAKDKEICEYLDGLRTAAKERKSVLEKAAEEEEQKGSSIGRLLTTRTESMLKDVRKGQERYALVGEMGSKATVILSRQPIPPGIDGQVVKHLQVGRIMFFRGTCSFDQATYDFKLLKSPPGIARKIKQALLEQTGMKVKVSVSRPDGEKSEDDDTDSADEESPVSDGSHASMPATASDTSSGTTSRTASDSASDSSSDNSFDSPSNPDASGPGGREPDVPPAAAEPGELAIQVRAVVSRVTGLGGEIRALVAGRGAGGVAVRELLNDITDLSKRQRLEPLRAAAAKLENLVWAASERVDQKILLQQEFEPLRDRLPELVDAQPLDPDWVAVQARPALGLRNQISGMLATDSKATLADIRQALTGLQRLEGPLREMHAKRLALADFRRTRLADIEKTQALQVNVDVFLAPAFTSLAQALQPLVAPSGLATASLADVQQLVAVAIAAQQEVRTRVSSRFGARLAARQGGTVRQQLVDEPAWMEQLVQERSGRQMLDAVVADIGNEVRNPQDAEFLVQALQTRFGARFSGELSEDAGLRLYGVFAKVPDLHTRLNPLLAEVKRNKKIVLDSWYDVHANPAEGLGPHNIVINAVRTSGILGFMGDLIVNNTSGGRYRHVRNGRQINQFDAMVLHEIGHSVDEKMGFMKTRGAESRYGGWIRHTQDEVAEKIGLESGFFSQFPGQSRPMLKAYLHQALGKDFDAAKFRRKSEIGSTLTEADLRQDAGMLFAAGTVVSQEWQIHRDPAHIAIWTLEAQKEITLQGPATAVVKEAIADIILGRPFADVVAGVLAIAMRPGVDWGVMKAHRGTRACLASRIVGRRGLWSQGEGAREFAMAGRIHQECYTGTWYSYDVAARADRVSDYQFRAPGEWFAESYSAYYQDKLPIDHPMTPVFALDAD